MNPHRELHVLLSRKKVVSLIAIDGTAITVEGSPVPFRKTSIRLLNPLSVTGLAV
jgi:hypothetical protein